MLLLAALGRVAWAQPAGQAKTSYAYMDGLLASSTLEGSGGALETALYGYFPDGRLKSLLDPSGQTRSYTWTQRGSLASEACSDGSTLERTDYTYDVAGELHPDSDLLATVTSPGGTTTRTNDAFGRLEGLSGAVDTTFTWEAGGARLLGVAGGGLHETRCYDGAGRIASVTNDSIPAGCELAPSNPLARFEYAYDARGNRSSEQYTDADLYPSSETTEYGYDAADRLTGVRYGLAGTSLYLLDGAGTRRQEKHLQGYVGALGPAAFASAGAAGAMHLVHQHDSSGGLSGIQFADHTPFASYATDDAGRLLSESRSGVQKTFVWDGQRLASATVSRSSTSTTVTYRYDHAGRRIARTAPTSSSTYLWADGELVEEQPQGGSARVYQRTGDLTIAVGDDRVLHDSLGSAVGRLGPSTSSPTLHRQDAWGGFRDHPTDPALWPTPGISGPGYAGQHWDPDAGLSYAEQRWYAPELGQFLSEDPFPGHSNSPITLHPFVYANANPLRFVDPSGLLGTSIGGDDAFQQSRIREIESCTSGDEDACTSLLGQAALGTAALSPKAFVIGAGFDAWLQVAHMADAWWDNRPVLETNFASMATSGAVGAAIAPAAVALPAWATGAMLVVGGGLAMDQAVAEWHRGNEISAVANVGLGFFAFRGAKQSLGRGNLGRDFFAYLTRMTTSPARGMATLPGSGGTSAAEELARLAPGTGGKSVGTTVLGRYPAYVEKAAELDARRFSVPTEIWNKMSPRDQWSANQKFLDRMIARGDDIILASPLEAAEPGTFFARELAYLRTRGFTISSDGARVLPPSR